ncbi:5'/3'-nucleotidase SurE [Oxalobacter vibrioformis]|uniref:5'-nucleotidase SurE n=1 Tax=Oxalobacter vibrioformis TaxID=933080 RepID=A0A9E9P2R4_9BURK|nr:5'/3'-nucleotidase SurE [Oxalobacter vibrioformis]WAW09495.1 5'/3'-nucleotidase SurE [Oxalobacter vibrioformis]
MRILISNDDGYLAPGINALARALAPIAEIAVCAPDSNRSGASNSLTLEKPISVYQAENGFNYTTGTPSDCVHIALTGILSWKPDLVVSGINHGANMGEDTLYSGTVAAAMEAFLFDIPAIAFSQVERGWMELESAAKMAREIVLSVYESLSGPFLLNVNIPNLPYEKLKAPMATRLGRRHHSEGVLKTIDPFGREMFWIGPTGKTRDGGEGTDFYATQNGYVSVTPLKFEWTEEKLMDELQKVLK